MLPAMWRSVVQVMPTGLVERRCRPCRCASPATGLAVDFDAIALIDLRAEPGGDAVDAHTAGGDPGVASRREQMPSR
jgi:hypothetical protein